LGLATKRTDQSGSFQNNMRSCVKPSFLAVQPSPRRFRRLYQ